MKICIRLAYRRQRVWEPPSKSISHPVPGSWASVKGCEWGWGVSTHALQLKTIIYSLGIACEPGCGNRCEGSMWTLHKARGDGTRALQARYAVLSAAPEGRL